MFLHLSVIHSVNGGGGMRGRGGGMCVAKEGDVCGWAEAVHGLGWHARLGDMHS